MEIETLKHLALMGALQGQISVSSSILGSLLGTSPQTAGRRLCLLEEEGCIKRIITGTGQKVKITEKGMLILQAEYQDYKKIFEDSDGGAHAVRGVVVGGLGEGQYYISREGYCTQFRRLLGFEPFAGTLNIRLDEPFVPSNLQAIKIEGFRDEGRTFGECKCYRILVNGIEAAIVRPDRSNYPAHLVEVVAPVRLRDALHLADGDPVEVTLQ
jgi:riboflavin kinase